MPHIFLSDEAVLDLQSIVQEQIKDLEKQIWLKKAIWNDLGNKITIPEKVEPELKCPDGLKGLGKQAAEQNTIKVEQPPAKPEQPEPKDEQKHNRWAGVNMLQKDDILIPKFIFDKDRKQFFKNIFFVEEPDGRVAIMYTGSTYYTTKDRILGVPYPFPPNYFDSKRGWNSTVEQAVKKYRTYLATQKPEEKDDPDRIYKPLLKTDTHAVHGEDYEKVEGTME